MIQDKRTDENWIQTYSGGQFWPTCPRVSDVFIEDIAHSLANTCRWTGHTYGFYSVAQHSVLVSWHCQGNPKWGLMHDAAEAYIGDIASPLKTVLIGAQDIEAKLLAAIARRFRLQLPIPDEVKRADRTVLATERRDLLQPCEAAIKHDEQVECLPDRISPWTSHTARRVFLDRFHELFD